MTCIYDVLEEYDERSDGAGLVGTHESRGIEKGKAVSYTHLTLPTIYSV